VVLALAEIWRSSSFSLFLSGTWYLPIATEDMLYVYDAFISFLPLHNTYVVLTMCQAQCNLLQCSSPTTQWSGNHWFFSFYRWENWGLETCSEPLI
jgi:hypothetical protein